MERKQRNTCPEVEGRQRNTCPEVDGKQRNTCHEMEGKQRNTCPEVVLIMVFESPKIMEATRNIVNIEHMSPLMLYEMQYY